MQHHHLGLKNLLLVLILIFSACGTEEPLSGPPLKTVADVISELKDNYTLLPEGQVAASIDSSVFAQYTDPTSRYDHGVMGDKIEGGGLVVFSSGVFHELSLDSDYVFEDIRPRLIDADQDGDLEILCIRTHVERGAGIVIYEISDNQLKEYAHVDEIGTRNRWLNYVAADDFDDDGNLELAWIETPHIGGILKVARIERGSLNPIDETSQYSNHGFGERNLCLSALTDNNNQKVIYVPNQNRSKIVGFSFQNNALELVEEIDFAVDFSVLLIEQYSFEGLVVGEDNCIR